MTQFCESPPLEADRQQDMVQSFLLVSEDKIRAHALWRDSSVEELDEMSEALERFVLSKIYRVIFAPNAGDLEKDAKLKSRIEEVSWLEPRHLDIQLDLTAKGTQRVLALAIEQLRSWNSYKGEMAGLCWMRPSLHPCCTSLQRRGIRWFVF